MNRMFEQIKDPESGLTFAPEGGTAVETTYRVSGPNSNGGTIRARTGASPWALSYAAYEQGAAKPQPSDKLPSIASRHW